jgi:hypothetical protein
MKFSMIACMDGNDSLKRMARRENTIDDDGNQVRGEASTSNERDDSRVGGGDYFLSQEEVNKWGKGALKDMPAGGNEANTSPCSERWKNLKEEVTSKMWSIYDETGIFACICRHGFLLIMVDMVKSGEL